MNWWWTVHERLFMWTFQELLMNCSWTIFFHNKFLNSSWTVMVNCSWTLVHEPTMRVFYELFMNCSWMFMNVHEQFIKSWTTFHRGNWCCIYPFIGFRLLTWIQNIQNSLFLSFLQVMSFFVPLYQCWPLTCFVHVFKVNVLTYYGFCDWFNLCLVTLWSKV